MTTKKVLLMVGLLAAIGLAYWAFNGTPVDDGEEGAIGAANRYRAEQINDSDVNLEDEDVITLLQDDVFLELIQDEDFQTLMANANFAEGFAKNGDVAYWGSLSDVQLAAHPDIAGLAARGDDLMALAMNQDVRAFLGKRSKISDGSDKEKGGPKWSLSRSEIAELSKVTDKVMAEKGYKVMGLEGKNVAQALNQRAIMVALARPDIATLLRNPAYMDFAKNADIAGLGKAEKVALGKTEKVALGKTADVSAWQKNYKLLAARPDMQALEKQHMASLGKQNVEGLSKQQVEALNKQNVEGLSKQQVEALNKQNVEGLSKQQIEALNKQHVAGAWSRNPDLVAMAMRPNVAKLMANPKVAAWSRRADVSLAMTNTVARGDFASRDAIQAAFGKQAVATP